jgi:hypothetical protein
MPGCQVFVNASCVSWPPSVMLAGLQLEVGMTPCLIETRCTVMMKPAHLESWRRARIKACPCAALLILIGNTCPGMGTPANPFLTNWSPVKYVSKECDTAIGRLTCVNVPHQAIWNSQKRHFPSCPLALPMHFVVKSHSLQCPQRGHYGVAYLVPLCIPFTAI